MEIEKIKIAVAKDKIEWRKHALQRMLEKGIKREDVKEVITKGELIEDYANDKPFPSALFSKICNKRPLHVVMAFDEKESRSYIITVYEPTLEIFKIDYKTRKKK